MAETKSTLSTLPAGSLKPVGGALDQAELSPADQKYNAAMERIMSALDAREHKGYDPTLLAIAQGLLTPGQTGSFFEGVGKAAGNVQQQQKEAQKEELDNAQMRLQLAQAEREQEQLLKAQRGFQQIAGGAGQQPAAGGAGAAGQAGAPKGQDEFKTVTVQDALRFAAAFPKNEKMASMLMDAAKAGSDRYKIAMNGTVFDSWAGKYVTGDIPGQTASDYNIPGVGVLKMTPSQYSSYEAARQAGTGPQWLKDFMSPLGPAKAPAASPAPVGGKPAEAPAGTEPIVVKNQADLDAEAAAKRELATKMAASEAERTNLVKDAGKAARGAQPGYARAEEILKTPGIDKVMGLVNKGDVVSGITNLVTDTLKVGNYTVGIPAIKKILTDSGVPQNVLNKALELAQLEAMWQMESRRGLGNGTSVSNMEQMMANRITPSQDDPMGAYKQKLAFLQEKAKFDIEMSRELSKSGMSIDKFEATDKFDSIFNAYKNRLSSIVSGEAPKPDAKGSSAQTGPITPESLRKRLNLPR